MYLPAWHCRARGPFFERALASRISIHHFDVHVARTCPNGGYLRTPTAQIVGRYAAELKTSPLLSRLLVATWIQSTPASVRRYLSSSLSKDLPSPFEMADMEAAVRRIVAAIKNRQQIGIWGDYDVDGTTGASVLVSFLREIGAQPIYHVPHRIEEGYGLNVEGLARLKERGVDLVITVDCGISNAGEVAAANAMGLDVVVVDHHQPPPENCRPLLPSSIRIAKIARFPTKDYAPPVWHFTSSSDCARSCANKAGSRARPIRIFGVIWILSHSARSPTWCRSEESIAR